MPEGQYSGQKCTYEYTTDLNATYLIVLDATLGDLTDNGMVLATETTTGVPAPSRFEPRQVFWVGTLNGRPVRKRIICGDANAPLYATDVSQNLTIDGVAGRTTGRKGEKLTFVNICQPATP